MITVCICYLAETAETLKKSYQGSEPTGIKFVSVSGNPTSTLIKAYLVMYSV